MKRNILLATLFIATLGVGSLHAKKPAPKNDYRLVWHDEFDYSTPEIERHWTIAINGNGNGNNELQYYRKENLSTGKYPNGKEQCLIISARKEQFGSRNCTSGRITTKNRVAFTYGKIEARIKLPQTADGLWPAFWLLGDDYDKVNWPKCGEIDILEMGHVDGIKNGTQNRLFNGACHWGESWNNGSYPNFAQHRVNEYDLQSDFHLYTVIWDKSDIRMYVDLDKYPDAAPYFALSIAGDAKENSPARYFHKPFNILLNLAVGGNFTQLFDVDKVTALPANGAQMYVDFVRVYQLRNEGKIDFAPEYKK